MRLDGLASRGAIVGTGADADGDIEAVPVTGPSVAHSRDAARDSMFLQATLRPLNGDDASFNVRVRNLSAGGLMAEADVAAGVVIVIDDRISVGLRNVGTVGGKVAWVRGGRFGVTFDVAIDPKLARKPVKQDIVQPTITGSGYHRVSHPLG